MHNKLTICLLQILLFTFMSINASFAQQYKTTDQEIRDCITQYKKKQTVVDSGFSAYQWAVNLEKNCGKVIDGNFEAGLLFEIAQEKIVTDLMVSLSNRCGALKPVKKYLKTIQKIFKNSVKTKKSSKKVGELFTERVESVSLKKYHLRKIRKRAGIVAKLLNGKKLKIWEKLLD